jgi:hypothetical protein
VPDVGVPHDLDWYGSRGNSSEFRSEKKLAVALLVDALRMIQERSAESKEALNWLMGRAGYRDDWVFSAESVCDALNLDIAALRARLRCLVALDNPSHRMHRVPVVYKDRPGYRERSRRTAHVP